MRRLFSYWPIFAVILSAVACGQAGSPSVASSPAPAVGRQEGGTRLAWETEWEKTVAEARKEGRVTVIGPIGGNLREAVIREFQKAHPGITMEYTALDGPQAVPKITAERNAGLFTTDILMDGPSVMNSFLKPFGVPVQDFLILPEVKDGKNWIHGRLRYADGEEKLFVAFAIILQAPVGFNTRLLDAKKMEGLSLWELTKPEWKGKIAWQDPRFSGFGRGVGWFIYHSPQLGPDWFRAVARNEPVFSRDPRLLTEWVAKEKYPLVIGPDLRLFTEFTAAGASLKAVYTVKEGAFAGSGSSYLMVMDKMPHPNAGKVFLNWFLSKEGQLVYSKETGFGSLRIGVPADHLVPESVVKPGDNYAWLIGEEVTEQQLRVSKFSEEVFGR